MQLTQTAADLELVEKNLKSIIMGLTSPRNACWATVKPWTKKERDETILVLARRALDEILRPTKHEFVSSFGTEFCEVCNHSIIGHE